MKKARPTHDKRQREQRLLQNRKDKAARLKEAHAANAQMRAQRRPGEDPDIAGITPGPQPSPWADFAPPMPDTETDADDE